MEIEDMPKCSECGEYFDGMSESGICQDCLEEMLGSIIIPETDKKN
jgi:NMD protein affecting ribosome stability and mRNA decay